jgi:hypothetical protein
MLHPLKTSPEQLGVSPRLIQILQCALLNTIPDRYVSLLTRSLSGSQTMVHLRFLSFIYVSNKLCHLAYDTQGEKHPSSYFLRQRITTRKRLIAA